MSGEMDIAGIKEKFHRFGYKYTEQRKMVMDVLYEHPDLHLSSEDICAYLKQKNVSIGQSTVYRTLLMLEKMKIARKTDLDDHFARYELYDQNEEHAHHHLICSECGSVIDIKGDSLDELERQIYRDYGFQVQDHCLKFFGECQNCRDKGRGYANRAR